MPKVMPIHGRTSLLGQLSCLLRRRNRSWIIQFCTSCFSCRDSSFGRLLEIVCSRDSSLVSIVLLASLWTGTTSEKNQVSRYENEKITIGLGASGGGKKEDDPWRREFAHISHPASQMRGSNFVTNKDRSLSCFVSARLRVSSSLIRSWSKDKKPRHDDSAIYKPIFKHALIRRSNNLLVWPSKPD